MGESLNRLLDGLSSSARNRLISLGTTVRLPQGAKLFEANERSAYAYFLTTGMASIVVNLADGGSVEIGAIGSEGVIGLGAVLGKSPPVAQCYMQISGAGIRIPVDDLRRAFHESEEIRGCLLASFQHQTLAMNQIAACNKLHQASERLARWLLTASDLTSSSTVALTQEALSQMLGTRRTTVALVAGLLQRGGLIRYRRGVVTILDRTGMEEAACDCYRIVGRLLDDMFETTAPKQ